MAFQDVVGHSTKIELLKRALVNQRVSHAYLFVGAKGIGKEFVARQFAVALNCLNEEQNGCGTCRSCLKFQSGNHPDFQIIRPIANSIVIEQIRNLQKDLVYKPYESRWKIYIVDEAEKMTLEAANSLLKTLEEPPQYAVIILISSQKDALLPTILSRCQLIQFSKLSKDDLRAYFEKITEPTLSKVDLDEVISLSDGSIGQALKLLKDDQIWLERKRIIEFLLKLRNQSNLEIYEMIRSLRLGKDLRQWEDLMKIIQSVYHDLVILKSSSNRGLLINQVFFSELKLTKDNYSRLELEEVIKLIERTNNLSIANVDRELALEVMLQKIKAQRM